MVDQQIGENPYSLKKLHKLAKKGLLQKNCLLTRNFPRHITYQRYFEIGSLGKHLYFEISVKHFSTVTPCEMQRSILLLAVCLMIIQAELLAGNHPDCSSNDCPTQAKTGESNHLEVNTFWNPLVRGKEMNINIGSTKELEIELKILDQKGGCRAEERFPVFKGNNSISIPMDSWPEGDYSLLFNDGSQMLTKTISI